MEVKYKLKNVNSLVVSDIITTFASEIKNKSINHLKLHNMYDKKLKDKYQYVVTYFVIDNNEYIYYYLNRDLTFTTEFDSKKARLYKRFDNAWKKADSLLDNPDIHRVAVRIVHEGKIVEPTDDIDSLH